MYNDQYRGYVLTHSSCNDCVWGENGFYNSVCAHCPLCSYVKRSESNFMTREFAEKFGFVAPKESAK